MNNNADNIINIKLYFRFKAELDKYFCSLFKHLYINIKIQKISNLYKKTCILIINCRFIIVAIFYEVKFVKIYIN